MTYTARYFRQWIRYTPVFFANAPALHWSRYFASCRRVVGSILYAEDELAKCGDVWDFGSRRGELLRAAEESAGRARA